MNDIKQNCICKSLIGNISEISMERQPVVKEFVFIEIKNEFLISIKKQIA